MSEARRIVESGYDSVAERYLEWSARIADDPRSRFLGELTGRLDDGARVLDLGCGAGVPSTAALAGRHDVLGVDLSAAQLALARRNVPGARFERGDMTALSFPDGSFAAVTAFYSVLHVPREEHGGLFARIAAWLRPGGWFLAALGCSEANGVEAGWLGAPMFFSSHSPAENRRLLEAAGFTLEVDEIVTMREPEGPATFHWVLGRR
ncbi:methyltransferase type 11 [Amycolatopsis mediterranei S699]|uniref:Methyltransferase type 11 n=2 Tax=Amycolatopsis mediterranei TaxID=33910 RepID=A0A0H3DFE4_AMYMU|nr:class I SAM-dependent methyltransferase [Amycolatopsis mediterranei]ADJ49640.1 methyltransferase type 11 [Amycolatopsis mediterranei U32]AEK46624.1 methyltransferase type 11 [Amycolatopsis mediterranei S699]AFO81350.1 methyltransferase type 11 [Amycolatopsis mediterranei S699]AGT88478.1 methyltransferase type 11 [Amycolatopsis mediterranei RB]KDO08111.1 methyltransferase type 11 [Amycolatopsis mediterranei]